MRAPAGSRPAIQQYPRAVVVMVSLVTIGWLLLQSAAGLRQTDQTYPVTGYSMFSYPSGGLGVEFELQGATEAGEPVLVQPADFGLTDLQLRSFIVDHVGPSPEHRREHARQGVADLASVWSERHDPMLTELRVVRVEYPPEGEEPQRFVVQSWAR